MDALTSRISAGTGIPLSMGKQLCKGPFHPRPSQKGDACRAAASGGSASTPGTPVPSREQTMALWICLRSQAAPPALRWPRGRAQRRESSPRLSPGTRERSQQGLRERLQADSRQGRQTGPEILLLLHPERSPRPELTDRGLCSRISERRSCFDQNQMRRGGIWTPRRSLRLRC